MACLELGRASEHMPRSPRIVVIEPSGVRRDVPLNASPFRIGRQAGNELTLRDSRISRQQAQILSVNGGWVLEDFIDEIEGRTKADD